MSSFEFCRQKGTKSKTNHLRGAIVLIDFSKSFVNVVFERRLMKKLFRFFSIMWVRAQKQSFKVGSEVMQMESNESAFGNAHKRQLRRPSEARKMRKIFAAIIWRFCLRKMRKHLEKLFVRQRRSGIAGDLRAVKEIQIGSFEASRYLAHIKNYVRRGRTRSRFEKTAKL